MQTLLLFFLNKCKVTSSACPKVFLKTSNISQTATDIRIIISFPVQYPGALEVSAQNFIIFLYGLS